MGPLHPQLRPRRIAHFHDFERFVQRHFWALRFSAPETVGHSLGLEAHADRVWVMKHLVGRWAIRSRTISGRKPCLCVWRREGKVKNFIDRGFAAADPSEGDPETK